jgi:hypothetical protein
MSVREQSINRSSQRILANFGAILEWQRHAKPTYELHHAKVLALVQSIVPKHEASVLRILNEI